MTQYDRGYPYTDEAADMKFGIIAIAIVILLYYMPDIYRTGALWLFVGTTVLLATVAVGKLLNGDD